MNWKTKIQFNTCRNDSNHMLDTVTNCRTRGLSSLNSNYGSTTFYQGLAIYHLRSFGPNCCLSNELLVLGKSAFLGQHICTKRELFKGHLWRVDRPQQWERLAEKGKLRLNPWRDAVGDLKESDCINWMKWVRVGKLPVYFLLLVVLWQASLIAQSTLVGLG